jgi:tRNA dimethylallyltransferase
MLNDTLAKDMRPILIAGPTASGKSALALALAERFGGVIINADSMQVYRELRILTARPADDDLARAPHKLYGFVPASDAYSTGRYVKDVGAALTAARDAGQQPIIVGGTGLYFKALLEGLSPIPEIPVEVRQHWRDLEARDGAGALWTILMHDDPEMARRLKPNDGQRIVRALEVFHATGTSLAAWQRTPGTPILDNAQVIKLVMLPPRQELRARADARFDQMLVQGALAEAEALAALNLDPALPAMRAIGVAPLVAAVRGKLSLVEATERAKAETRQYVKRQSTWLNRNMIAWNDVFAQSIESSAASAITFIQS